MENFKEKMQKSGMDTCNRWGIYEVAQRRAIRLPSSV